MLQLSETLVRPKNGLQNNSAWWGKNTVMSQFLGKGFCILTKKTQIMAKYLLEVPISITMRVTGIKVAVDM